MINFYKFNYNPIGSGIPGLGKKRMFKVSFNSKRQIVSDICLLFLILFVCTSLKATANTNPSSSHFDFLQQRLVKDGFSRDKIKTLYKDPMIKFETKSVSLYFKHSEARLNYDQFASGKSIKKAKKYMQKHKEALDGAEKAYGVDKEIITAIILVETRLGTVLGNVSILNILSTMASLSELEVRNMLWKKVSEKSFMDRKKFDKWCKRKSQWAYGELKAFLKHTVRDGHDPVSIFGSYAGAVGIAQFMPTNILILAKDGNKDGRVNLFDHKDAIASIANYLKHYGWHPNIEEKKAYKVLYRYNHSKYYVNTLLKIAEKLKS